MAYDIVKTLMEKKPELVAVHKEAQNIDLKYQKIGSPMPYHPGRQEVLRGAGRQVLIPRCPAPEICASAMGHLGATMSDERAQPAAPAVVAIDDERLKKAEAYIEEEEGAASRFRGWLGVLATTLLVVMSLFHLYAAVDIVPAQVLRPVHVGLHAAAGVPAVPDRHALPQPPDVVGRRLRAASASATIAYLLAGGDEFWDRNTLPSPIGPRSSASRSSLLVLEACRRTSGWIMLFVICAFLAYAFVGPWLPGQWPHRGYDVASMTGFLYQTLEGIFGTAVDVSSSLIILFTIYGAFLQQSGAGKFFLDWSFAAMGGKPHGRRAAPSCCRRSCWAGRPDRASRRR